METKLEIQKAPIDSGWMWIGQSFKVVKAQPFTSVGLFLVTLLLLFVPLINIPVFAKFAEMAHEIENGNRYRLRSVFKGLFSRPNLLRLALIWLILLIIYIVLIVLVTVNKFQIHTQILGLEALGTVVEMGLMFCIFVAPVICYFNPQVGAIKALGMSFKAGIYNIIPLIAYILLQCAIIFMAEIPLLIGIIFSHQLAIIGGVFLGIVLLVWYPMAFFCHYFAYKSFFKQTLA